MARLFVFGIGGTGARVLRSLTMLMASGVQVGVDEICPILIDPDAGNADLTRTTSLLNLYMSINSKLTSLIKINSLKLHLFLWFRITIWS